MIVIGHVHNETLGQNKNCHEWEVITLSDIDVVYGLVLNRCEYDKFYIAKLEESKSPMVMNDIPLFHEIIEVTYLDLEGLIERSNLTKKQKHVVDLIMNGYDVYTIANKIKTRPDRVHLIIKNACRRIVEQNNLEWEDWVETSGQIKIPDDVTFKKCTFCNRWLKANPKNYTPSVYFKDGLFPICKRCNN